MDEARDELALASQRGSLRAIRNAQERGESFALITLLQPSGWGVWAVSILRASPGATSPPELTPRAAVAPNRHIRCPHYEAQALTSPTPGSNPRQNPNPPPPAGGPGCTPSVWAGLCASGDLGRGHVLSCTLCWVPPPPGPSLSRSSRLGLERGPQCGH